MQLSGSKSAINLPGGDFTVNTATLRLDLTPSTDFSQSLLMQWDNISDELGVSARWRWRWSQENELFFSLDHLRNTESHRHSVNEPVRTTALLKIVWYLER